MDMQSIRAFKISNVTQYGTYICKHFSLEFTHLCNKIDCWPKANTIELAYEVWPSAYNYTKVGLINLRKSVIKNFLPTRYPNIKMQNASQRVFITFERLNGDIAWETSKSVHVIEDQI